MENLSLGIMASCLFLEGGGSDILYQPKAVSIEVRLTRTEGFGGFRVMLTFPRDRRDSKRCIQQWVATTLPYRNPTP